MIDSLEKTGYELTGYISVYEAVSNDTSYFSANSHQILKFPTPANWKGFPNKNDTLFKGVVRFNIVGHGHMGFITGSSIDEHVLWSNNICLK